MSIIKTYQGFTISSEKLDQCPRKYDAEIGGGLFAVSILACFGGVFYAAAINNPAYLIYGIFIGIIIFASMCIYGANRGCGVKLTLREQGYGDITTEYYTFTDNPENDAMHIKQVVEDLENRAISIHNTIQEKKREEKEKADACCNRYKEVMNRVKE